MVASRALLGRRSALVDVAAYQALPLDRFLALPHGVVLDALDHRVETVHMVVFDLRDLTEALCDFGEALFLGNLGRLSVSVDSLHALLFGGDLKVVECLADHTGVDADWIGLAVCLVEVSQEYLRMTQLVGRRLIQDVRILEIRLL